MYGRRAWKRQRRRKVMRKYLQIAVWGVSILCILIVFAAMMVKTMEAREVSAAEATVQTAAAQSEGMGQKTDKVKTGGNAEGEEEQQAVMEETLPEPTIIVIDPGHGGMDGGCNFGEILEKDINRQIADRVAEKLEALGYEVMFARKGGEYIEKLERVENANANNALLYVSIHQNSCEDTSVAGIETWYDGSDTTRDNKRLAQLIQQETIEATGAKDRELMSDPELCVTGKSKMPACLIETGFLSNAEERKKLCTEEYREQIAQGIATGIDLYLNPKVMYLTFDDGPSEESTDKILDILKERNIRATFFVIGEYVRKYPETAKRIVEEGHTIGIHCDVHDYASLYESVDSYVADFEKAYDTVYEITGVKAQLFRFPGGSVNAFNKEVCEDIIVEMEGRGFIYYDWNASLEDAVEDSTPDKLVQNAVDTTLGRQRVVMLAHDRVENTALALEDLIDAFPEYQMRALTMESVPVQF